MAKKEKTKDEKRKQRFSTAVYLGVGLGSALMVTGVSSAVFNGQWAGLYLAGLGAIILAVVINKEMR